MVCPNQAVQRSFVIVALADSFNNDEPGKSIT
jgi:hypothetical protein